MFWNVAGLGNKDWIFWRELEDWEVMVLSETWMEEKDWLRMKRSLPKGYVWGTQWANRKNKRGRAIIGGMLMRIRKEIVEKGSKMESDKDGFMVG